VFRGEKMKYGVIPCAGQGKRMGFLSYVLPKTLFPVWEKPLLHLIVENMLKLGVEKIFFIVNYKKEVVKEYLERTEFSRNFERHFIEQKELKGIAHAINLTKDFIDDDFICILGDDLTIAKSLDNLVKCFHDNNAILVEGAVPENDREILRSTCSIQIGPENKITKIVEKPEDPPSNIRGTGIYLFSPKIFDYIEKTPVSTIRNEIEITDTINLVAKDNKAYLGFIEGINVNINSMMDLFEAWKLMKNA